MGALAGIAFAAVSWALYGYGFGESANHAFYLPYVEALLAPGLYPGDAAVAAAGRAPGWFWTLFAAAAKPLGAARAALGLWFAARALAGWATWRAARALGGGRAGAALAVVFAACAGALFIDAPLAGDPLFKNFADQTSVAWAPALWAVALWLERRHAAAFVLLGLTANINPLVAGLGAAWLTVGGLFEESDDVQDALKHAAIFAVCAAPALWGFAAAGGGDIALLTAVAPSTYLPAVWSWERWVSAAAWLLLWGAVFSVHPSSRNLSSLLIAALVLWGGYVVCARIDALAPLLQTQLLRLDAPLCWLGAVAAGVLAAQWLGSQKAPTFFAAAALSWVFIAVDATAAMALWGVGLVMLENTERRRALWAFAGAVWAALSLRLPAGHMLALSSDTALATFVIASAAAVGGWSGGRPWRRKRHRAALALLALCALLPTAKLTAVRLRAGGAMGAEPGGGEVRAAPWEAWARTTPRDTLFIVSPGMSGFRLRSRRPTYFEWTDFNAAVYDRPAARTWCRRLKRLGTDCDDMAARRRAEISEWDRAMVRRVGAPPPVGPRAWNRADSARLRNLARDIGASYIVAPARADLDLPTAHDFHGTVIHGLK